MPLFFLGGVHGAGKTTLGTALSVRLSAKLLTASQLIREEGIEPSSPDKRVADIDGNQVRLLRALARYRAAHVTLLLDGHFCIRSRSGEGIAISPEVFVAIGPDALVLLEDEPAAIIARLSSRDHVGYNLEDVRKFVDCERVAAHAVSTQLGIPLCVLHATDSLERALGFLQPKAV